MILVSLFAAAGAWAQPDAFPVVTPIEQAQRDATRLQILQTELAAEEAGLAEAAKRKAERTAAGDHPGASDAGEAVHAHQRNVSALRVEIDKVAASHAGVDRAAGSAPGTHPGAGLRQPRPGARAGGTRREALWWDAYGNPARGEAARPGASDDPAPQAPETVWWSAYPRPRTP